MNTTDANEIEYRSFNEGCLFAASRLWIAGRMTDAETMVKTFNLSKDDAVIASRPIFRGEESNRFVNFIKSIFE